MASFACSLPLERKPISFSRPPQTWAWTCEGIGLDARLWYEKKLRIEIYLIPALVAQRAMRKITKATMTKLMTAPRKWPRVKFMPFPMFTK